MQNKIELHIINRYPGSANNHSLLFPFSLLMFFVFFVGVCTAAPSATAATTSQLDKERLCAELTASGLGGGACGQSPSMDVQQRRRWQHRQQQQKQQQRRQLNESDGSVATPRRDLCPVLCANGLGRPLCECNITLNNNEVS